MGETNMKKLLMILMMVFAVGCGAFAKTITSVVNIGEEKYIFITDDTYKALPVDGRSDYEIVKLLKDCMPSSIGSKHTDYIGFVFNNELNTMAKTYPQYWLINEAKDYIFIDQSLSDGRMLRMIYLLTNIIIGD